MEQKRNDDIRRPPRCPGCGGEMTKGFITGKFSKLYWEPRRNWRFVPPEGRILLSDGNSLMAGCAIAWNCPACQKITIDYRDGACDHFAHPDES